MVPSLVHKDELPGKQREAWVFSVLMEEPTVEEEEETISGKATFFHMRVLCHERRVHTDKYSGGKEYSWHISRRFSDFMELDTQLRSSKMLPPAVAVPRKTFWRHLCPTSDFLRVRARELHCYLLQALDAVKEKEVAYPQPFHDVSQHTALPQFLGLEQQESGNKLAWMLPQGAELRHAALVYSLDKGVFIWAHDQPGDTGTRIVRFDRKASLGDLSATSATYAEARAMPMRMRAVTWPSSPKLPLQQWPWLNSPDSLCSTHLAESPVVSPQESPCMTPCRWPPWQFAHDQKCDDADECHESILSLSTNDTDLRLEAFQVGAAVWLEADLDTEREKEEEHEKWWDGLTQQRLAVKATFTTLKSFDARQRAIADFERTAALFRELSTIHEDLNRIIGYGVEGRTLAVVQQGLPLSCGLRMTPFTPERCHLILGQALKALGHLHEQFLPHGHLSPESILIEEGPLGPQVRLAWTPGQRRPEGHVSAMLGFRAPGPLSTASDIWAFACVGLVWWSGFQPTPHPWSQFSRSRRLQRDIQEALAEQPPERPKILLDMHSAAATADEPGHSFLALLASLFTRCLAWDPVDRPQTGQLLKNSFFEQAL